MFKIYHLLSEEFKIQIKCFYGFEEILAKEVQTLGGAKVKIKNRLVECFGDLGFLYKANLSLRTAIRIMVPIFEITAKNEDELYNAFLKFEFEKYLDLNQTFAIDATVNSETFSHSRYVSLKLKDAIADRFQKLYNERPSVDRKNPDIQFNLYISNQNITLSIDSCGESLHKRGYRKVTGKAPINEVLAASLLLQSGWDGKGNLLDPMCGSGTFLIEAAMIALNMPPQIHRKEFGFMNWTNFDEDLFEQILGTRIQKIKDFNGKIVGFDLNHEMIDASKSNLTSADLSEFVQLEQKDFFESEKEMFPTHLIMNPPYNERLPQKNEQFYQQIGNTLKFNYPNTFSWIITSDLNARKKIGLRPSKRIKCFNGKLECDFLCYETYAGSRKASKINRDEQS